MNPDTAFNRRFQVDEIGPGATALPVGRFALTGKWCYLIVLIS